jgi:hypothetical protein
MFTVKVAFPVEPVVVIAVPGKFPAAMTDVLVIVAAKIAAYSAFGTARPAASRNATVIVARSPGRYELLSKLIVAVAGVEEPTRIATGADVIPVVAVAVALVVNVMFAVPAATPTRLQVTLPSEPVVPHDVYALETTVVVPETALTVAPDTGLPLASVTTAVIAPSAAPAAEAGITELTTVGVIVAAAPWKINDFVETTVVPTVTVIVAVPVRPSEKT